MDRGIATHLDPVRAGESSYKKQVRGVPAFQYSFTMYFLSLSILTLLSSVLAQSVSILTPASNQSILRGRLTVQVALPDTVSPSETVSIVIGLQNCVAKPCPKFDNDEILGEILFAGAFKPKREDPTMPPYQNFTFNVSNVIPGESTLHVAQFFLLGAGPTATISTQNVSIHLK